MGYEAIGWAVENGITTGTSDTTFSPNDTLTRAQMVTFLKRYHDDIAAHSQETDAPQAIQTTGDWEYDTFGNGMDVILLESSRISSDAPLPFPGIAQLGVGCHNADLVWFLSWPIDIGLNRVVVTIEGTGQDQWVDALESSSSLMLFDSSSLNLLNGESVIVGTQIEGGGAVIASFKTAGLSENLPLLDC